MKTLLRILLTACLLLSVRAGLDAKSPADDPMAVPLGDFKYQGTMRQAIEKIGDVAKVRIEVDWNALAASGARFDAGVKLSAAKATPGQLLDSALAQAAAAGNPLTWQVKDNVVRVTTQARVLNLGGAGNYVPVAPDAAKTARAAAASAPGQGQKASPPSAAGAAKRELAFENTPLGDVLELCRRSADVNMHVNWKALGASNVDKNTPVSLQLSNVTIAKVLDLVLEGINAGKDKTGSVYWIVDGGVMLVSTGAALDTEMRTRTIEVADLLMVVPNFKGPVFDLSNVNNNTNNGSSGTGGNTGNSGNTGVFGTNTSNTGSGSGSNTGGEEDKSTAEQRKQIRDTLIAAIQDSIGKDMWEPQGKGSIRLLGNQLIITQSLLGWKLMEKTGAK